MFRSVQIESSIGTMRGQDMDGCGMSGRAFISKLFLIVAAAITAVLVQGCGSGSVSRLDFAPLFNGKDLAGWQAEGGANWTVQNRAIVGTQGEDNVAGDLFTEKIYRDFILAVTYRVEWPCNSGIWFRYQNPDKAYQADILEYQDPECYSGTLYCPGKLFLAMNTDKTLVNREGWNTIKVRAKGDHLQIWLNGRQVADVRDRTSASGRIGFQVHEGEQFGRMKIIVREVLLRQL